MDVILVPWSPRDELVDEDVLDRQHMVAGSIDRKLLICSPRDDEIHLSVRPPGPDQVRLTLVLKEPDIKAGIDESGNYVSAAGSQSQ